MSEDLKSLQSFMDMVDRKFFAPLPAQNNKLLFECINLLMDGSKEFGVLYEKNAKRILQEYLEEKKNEITDDDAETEDGWALNRNAASNENAGKILKRFRDCGWVTSGMLGDNGEMLASVTKYCRETVRAFNRIYNENIENDIRNDIISMYEILKSAVKDRDPNRTERPYTSIFRPLDDLKSDLYDRLSSLNEEVEAIKRQANAISSISGLSDILCEGDYKKKFLPEYEKLNQHGLITSDLTSIQQMLTVLKRSKLYNEAIRELEQNEKIPRDRATNRVDEIYYQLKEFVDTGYDRAIEHINGKINGNYTLYNRKVMMLTRDKDDMIKRVKDVCNALQAMDASKGKYLLGTLRENTINIYRAGIVDFDSVKRKSHHKKDHDVHPVIDTLPDEVREAESRRMRKFLEEPYGTDSVREYFDDIVPENDGLRTEDMAIDDERDVLMLTSIMLHQETDACPYTLEIRDGETNKGKVKIQNMTIKRKEMHYGK